MIRPCLKILFITLITILLLGFLVSAEEYTGSYPEEFNQAPILDNAVQSGDLPHVEERLPEKEDVYVVDPNEKVGEYGGTIHSSALSYSFGADYMLMDQAYGLTKSDPKGSNPLANVAKKFEPSSDMTTWTFYLRKGMKWSDGHPFTADDILFWYEDVLLNEELTPVIRTIWKPKNEEIMKLEKIDDYTFQIKYPIPIPKELIGHAFMWGAGVIPKHFLKKFHPKYTSEEELNAKVEENNFDHWYQLFEEKMGSVWERKLGTPTLAPYKLVKETSDRRVWERNPYFWKVDPEGNQLPYVDRIETEIVGDREVINGRILSGQIDFAAYQTDIRNFPMYREYEDEGNYRTLLWTNGFSSDVSYQVNMNHEDSVLREIFQDVRFRRALSLAIDRNEINESIYFGKAQEVQFTAHPESTFYKEEYAKAYSEFDPEKAEELLDEIGLDEKDSNGYRLRPDGEPLTFTIEYVSRETPKTPNVELVVSHWRDVGLDVNSKQISGELAGQRAPGNMMDASLWHSGEGTYNINFSPMFVPLIPGWSSTTAPLWARWNNTDGEEGEEPPEDIKRLQDWTNEIKYETDKEERKKLADKILRSQAENVWNIGTVGAGPWPVIAKNNLRNLPEEVIWGPGTQWTMSRDPSQYFFEQD